MDLIKVMQIEVSFMYQKTQSGQIEMTFPFNVELNPESKWVVLADRIPWDRIEEEYVKHFTGNEGQVAKSARLAFSALYIQTSEGLTDEKTKEHIQENPHMQYFCGMTRYTTEPPFDASLMVHFRKRFPEKLIRRINEEVFGPEALNEMDGPVEDEIDCTDEETEVAGKGDNRGTLLLDATCCPQDIRYPTDIGLLNQARELTEEIIDKLFKTVADQYEYKPRTYRKVARKDYLAYTKTRKHSPKMIRKNLRKQLQYAARDLRIIDGLIDKGALLSCLDRQLYRKLLVAAEVYRQQKEMYDAKTHRCDGRIVSITQPHIRPIVRGKEHAPTEFGSKVAIGMVGGYAFITDISWENIPEASLLPAAAEQYKSMFGFYPQSIIGDRVYPNRHNRDWCNERGIRLSGLALGRKTKETKREERKRLAQDACERNAIEGEFGVTKRKLGLDQIMPKLPNTSLTAVAMGFFAANMERKLRLLFAPDFLSFVYYDFDWLSLVISDGYLFAS
jgi:hypothetical protein